MCSSLSKFTALRTGSITRAFHWIALLVAVMFLMGSSLRLTPQTRVGVQCPTAPIQSVLVPVKNKCGCVIAYRSVTPKLGDKAFVQCRCAEKKSADQTVPIPPKSELFVVQEPNPVYGRYIPSPRRQIDLVERLSSAISIP